MANRIEKLPLTTYDVLGYFVPGLIAVVLSLVFFHGVDAFDVGISSGREVTLYHAAAFIAIVVFSYVSGHVVALVSAIAIERIVIISYGYPSVFLLRRYNLSLDLSDRIGVLSNLKSAISLGDRFFKSVILLLIYMLFLPHILVAIVLDRFGFSRAIIKPLPAFAVSKFCEKFKKIFSDDPVTIEPEGWFFIAQHFMITGGGSASLRMYNYLNLYGFCRNMSLVCNFGFIVFMYYYARYPASHHYLPASLVFCTFSIILFFGFIKFYRRYSSEVIMGVGVYGASIDKGEKKPTD